MTSHDLASPADSARLKTSQPFARLASRPAHPASPQGRGPTPLPPPQRISTRRVTPTLSTPTPELYLSHPRPNGNPLRQFHLIPIENPCNSTNCTKFHVAKTRATTPRTHQGPSRHADRSFGRHLALRLPPPPPVTTASAILSGGENPRRARDVNSRFVPRKTPRPLFAKRTSIIGHQICGGLGKPIPAISRLIPL